MMPGVATLRSKEYGECQLSAINNSGDSIKNREYFPEFEAKFVKPSDTELGAWKKPFIVKTEAKNLVELSL
jgi:hypothetical protein